MPGYVQPSAADIRRLTGVSELMDGLSAEDLDAALVAPPPSGNTDPAMGLVWDAEDETALQVGLALWDSSDLSVQAAGALAKAVALRTGAAYLRTIAAKKVAAAKRPHVMEDSDRILAVAEALEAKAAAFDELVKGEIIEVPSGPGGAAIRVTGRARMGLVTPLPVTVRPSERVRDLDEREDFPAGQLLNGRRWR